MNLRHYNPEILKRLREKEGHTQEAVAAKLKVTRQTVIRAERGLDVSYELLCNFAEWYGIPVVSLLYPTPLPAEEKAAA